MRVWLLEEDTAMSVENTNEFNKHLLELIIEVNRVHDMRPPYKYEFIMMKLKYNHFLLQEKVLEIFAK